MTTKERGLNLRVRAHHGFVELASDSPDEPGMEFVLTPAEAEHLARVLLTIAKSARGEGVAVDALDALAKEIGGAWRREP